MDTRHEIEVWMTFALVMYVGAYFLVKRKFVVSHILCALMGFVADIYATTLMIGVLNSAMFSFAQTPIMLKFHLMMSLLAIGAFLVQATLGTLALTERALSMQLILIQRHRRFAVFSFFPIWAVSYVSGFALALI